MRSCFKAMSGGGGAQGSKVVDAVYWDKLNEVPDVKPDTVIEYLTDVEGNWDYMVHFISKSSILKWEGPTQGIWGPGTLKIKPHGILVFGGDAPDKGPGDIRVIKQLIHLKRENPKQVFIILGNRDIIKLRFFAELQAGDSSPWVPPWDRARAQPYEEYLKKNQDLKPGQVSLCKWLMQFTMGCQDTTFGTRQEELALVDGPGHATDEDVIRSYIDSVDPSKGPEEAWMLDFLRLGLLGLVLGDTLFVHGGLQDESIGHVPGVEKTYSDVKEWIDALNAWKDAELAEYERQPLWTKGKDGELVRGATSLIEYGTPGAGKKSVVYYNPFQNGNPVQRTLEVQNFLAHSKIKRLVTGHQPHGQMPTVVRHPKTGLIVITADTSRSDADGLKVFNPANNRGGVVSVVQLKGDSCTIEGTGKSCSHKCTFHLDSKKDKLPDALIGRQLVDGSWVKSITTGDKPKVIAALGRGFDITVRHMDPLEACLELKDEYGHMDPDFKVNLQDMVGERFLVHWHREHGMAEEDESPSPKKRCGKLDRAEFEKCETFIFAFNGVIRALTDEQRKKCIDSINDLIAKRKRVVFVTNDSTMSRKDFAIKIQKQYGVKMDQLASRRPSAAEDGSPAAAPNAGGDGEMQESIWKHHVITSAFMAAWFVKKVGLKRPLVLCHGTGLLEELKQAGIDQYYATVQADGSRNQDFAKEANAANIVDLATKAGDIDSIITGFDYNCPTLGISVAAQYVTWREELIESGKKVKPIPIITTSMDETAILGRTPADFGLDDLKDHKVRALGTGAVARAVCNGVIAKKDVQPIDVGKPSPMLIHHLHRPIQEDGLGIDLSKAVVIGDGLETDIQMANMSSMKSLLVLSGVTNQAMLDSQEPSRLPTWTVDSFGDV